jgi:uncharacterized protein (DUF2164 family)
MADEFYLSRRDCARLLGVTVQTFEKVYIPFIPESGKKKVGKGSRGRIDFHGPAVIEAIKKVESKRNPRGNSDEPSTKEQIERVKLLKLQAELNETVGDLVRREEVKAVFSIVFQSLSRLGESYKTQGLDDAHQYLADTLADIRREIGFRAAGVQPDES